MQCRPCWERWDRPSCLNTSHHCASGSSPTLCSGVRFVNTFTSTAMFSVNWLKRTFIFSWTVKQSVVDGIQNATALCQSSRPSNNTTSSWSHILLQHEPCILGQIYITDLLLPTWMHATWNNLKCYFKLPMAFCTKLRAQNAFQYIPLPLTIPLKIHSKLTCK